MLVKYKYLYDVDNEFPYARLERYRRLSPHDEYGIVFGKIVDKLLKREDIYDIPLVQVVACMQGQNVPRFPTPIPIADARLIVDLVSDSWTTFGVTLDRSGKIPEYIYSKEPADVMISAFPEFFDNGFWYRANDLNLDYDENPAEGEMMRRYVCEYGKIYLNYIAERRQDFPGIDESWLKLLSTG